MTNFTEHIFVTRYNHFIYIKGKGEVRYLYWEKAVSIIRKMEYWIWEVRWGSGKASVKILFYYYLFFESPIKSNILHIDDFTFWPFHFEFLCVLRTITACIWRTTDPKTHTYFSKYLCNINPTLIFLPT